MTPMNTVGWLLLGILTVFEWVLILRAILSWIQLFFPQWRPRGILLILAEALYTVTDPPLRWLRKLIKPLRLGNVALDMGFMVLFVLIVLLMTVVQAVFFP
jgi:YggT family protein